MNTEYQAIQSSAKALKPLVEMLIALSENVLPKSEQWFALQADFPLEHLGRIHAELSAYVCEIQDKTEQAMTEQEAA